MLLSKSHINFDAGIVLPASNVPRLGERGAKNGGPIFLQAPYRISLMHDMVLPALFGFAAF